MNAMNLRLVAILVGLIFSGASLAGVTVGVNQLSVVHKSSDGVTIAFPDVCKTPAPGGPVPIPYPNVAKSADTAKGSRQTKVSPLDSKADKPRQPRLSSAENARTNNVVLYSLEAVTKGKLFIQQTAGKDSVTTATYVDDKGNSRTPCATPFHPAPPVRRPQSRTSPVEEKSAL